MNESEGFLNKSTGHNPLRRPVWDLNAREPLDLDEPIIRRQLSLMAIISIYAIREDSLISNETTQSVKAQK